MEEDARLVRRFVGGDHGAFDELAKRHYQRICNILHHTLGRSADIDDLAQEVLVKAYQALPHYRGEAAFSTWIFRIAVNVCLDELRQQKRRRIFSFSRVKEPEEGQLELEEKLPGGRRPDSEMEQKEVAEFLQKVMKKLPEKNRIVFTLRDIEGFSYSEIAGILQCSIGTVKSRLFYARVKLRQYLRPYLDESEIQE